MEPTLVVNHCIPSVIMCFTRTILVNKLAVHTRNCFGSIAPPLSSLACFAVSYNYLKTQTFCQVWKKTYAAWSLSKHCNWQVYRCKDKYLWQLPNVIFSFLAYFSLALFYICYNVLVYIKIVFRVYLM